MKHPQMMMVCKLMFNGSYPTPPVVCLSGNSKIPCTAFSSG